MKGILALGIGFFLFSLTLQSAQVEEVKYLGWKCLKMSNSTTEVYLAPEIGGRVIQYKYLGHPFLWVNKKLAGKVFPMSENNCLENWKNYGGDKVWPAPQGWDGPGQWPGPGDEVVGAPYRAEILKKKGKYVKVRLVGSDKGGYAGVQFIREFTLFDNSSRLYIKATMKNITKNRETNWGIWQVTQTDFSGPPPKTYNDKAYIIVPLNPQSIWPEKYKVMFGLAQSFNWQPDYEKMIMKIRYMNIVGKIGLDTYAGWAGLVDEQSGFCFVQRFETFPSAEYPDNTTFTSWVAGKGYFIHKHKLMYAEDDPDSRFVEMEILSPRIKLQPGQSYSFYSSWEAHKSGLEQVPDLEKGYLPPPTTSE